MSYTKRALKGFIIVFSINIIAAFLGYLIRIVLARNLTVAEYGLFFSIFTLIGLLGVFTGLGTGESIIKFIPEFLVKKRYDKVNSALIMALSCTFITLIIFSAILFFLSGFFADNYFKNPLAGQVLWLFIVIFFFSSFKGLVRLAFQAFQDMKTFSLIYLLENSLLLGLLIATLAFAKGIFSAAYIYILVNILLIIIFAPWLIRKFSLLKPKARFDKAIFNKLVKFGIYLIGANIGGIAILYIDTLVLTYFRSLSEVGVYNAVVPTVMIIQFFATSIVTVLFPMISELWASKKKEYLAQGLKIIYQYSFALMIPAVIIAFAFSGTILSLLFGQEYAAGAVTMQVLLVSIVFFSIFSITSAVLNGIGKPAINTRILLQGAMLNLVLNLVLVPKLGMLGAAITSLIAYAYIGIYSSIKLAKFIELPTPWMSWLKTTIIGIIVLLIIIFLKNLLVINIYAEMIITSAIAGLTYIGLLFLTKAIDLKELKSLILHVVK